MAAVDKENHEEIFRSNRLRNKTAPEIQEEYITQVSEEIDVRVSMKLPQEFTVDIAVWFQ